MMVALAGVALAQPATPPPTSPLAFTVQDITGKDVDLSMYRGQVVLMVNVASHCRYTPQYKALEALYQKYHQQGLVILGFPANDFGAQEPGTNAEIASFCSTTYGVTFPMFSKITVKGDGIAPLYSYLTSKDTDPQFGGDIKWNFTKFLINRQGQVVNRFEPAVTPDDPALVAGVEAELAKPAGPLSFTMRDIHEDNLNLATFRGKVVLIVNVASRCRFTPQYNGLEALYTKYHDQGLEILGFPANNFAAQEPGTDDDIARFCTTKNVTFVMFSKISVGGKDIAPLYSFLCDKTTDPDYGGTIKWNFTKFLVSRQDQVVGRFMPEVDPNDPALVSAIEAELAKPAP
jgi:glutathione peroxidase